MANKVTMQKLHEWGSMYEKKFEYVFVTCAVGRTSEGILTELKMRYRNTHVVELDIASKEEMNVSYSGEIVNDTLDRAETDSEDNLDDISSGEIDISRQFELNKVPEEENETLYTQQREYDVHAAKRSFNLNKKPWFV
ncbi:uncharacterized protein LOC107610738 [Arachis ipaensis]|uniref:uncharacterized protein LOC107610738 n=1 Tax=Arachis ipaensis TaxID=130454 RepID=UPI0007AF0001|nr:uncharacterized protein LOC107610738 [Arachis ipaensis]XP_025670027.1 uncharacterized protein LOC112769774 [Arachis hypogaea]